jgi:hypothetical protein
MSPSKKEHDEESQSGDEHTTTREGKQLVHVVKFDNRFAVCG